MVDGDASGADIADIVLSNQQAVVAVEVNSVRPMSAEGCVP